MELQVKNISFSYADEPLLTGVSFAVYHTQKVGLVGVNGAGKSTLLRLIRGIVHPDEGHILMQGTLGYVPQEVKYDEVLESAETVSSYVNPDHKVGEHDILKMCAGFGISDIDLTTKPSTFSGGVKTKLAIMRALIIEPDLLLLDEPTNFMDQEGKKWIMNLFARYPKALLLISHDLALMDTAIDSVLYVNPHTKTVEVYTGNYTSFRTQQKQAEDLLKRTVMIQSKKIKKMEESLIKVARYTSAKGQRVKTRLRHKLEDAKAKLPSLPPDVFKMKIQLPEPSRVGELPIMARSIAKSYGEYTVFKNLDFTIHRGERVALLGPNGAGKTTLIKSLLGQIPVESGTIQRAPNLYTGYYTQEMENLEMDAQVLDFFCRTVEKMESFGRSFLGGFGIMGNKVFQTVGSLSGGEKTRLSMALLCARPYNMLILDEPTTYLDVTSQRIILEALKSYKGTLLLVSHTEQFVQELNMSHVYLMPEGKSDYWNDKYLDRVGEV